MPGKKIFNDPVYGFVSIPYGIIFDLIEHPWFQRLRRIKQVSLTHLVYPGALHTRFHHALGALHLTGQAIDVLREKGIHISDAEALGVKIAILLHDIGHGPFSHTLESTLVHVPHEQMSAFFMQRLNREFKGELDLALDIFHERYPKRFLSQLVSGQLDMDRMDYLNRDSFFTGVYEGVIGYDRLIKMLTVHDDQLVVEEKGIYSVEKFLIARRLMYWQVYLHKAVLAAEHMLIRTLRRARQLTRQGEAPPCSKNLAFFLEHEITADDFLREDKQALDHFARLDDFDIVYALKTWVDHPDPLLAYLASCILNRRLFRLEFNNKPFTRSYLDSVRAGVRAWSPFGQDALDYLIIQGKESNHAYSTSKNEIRILRKDGSIAPISDCIDFDVQSRVVSKYFLSYPKEAVRKEWVRQK